MQYRRHSCTQGVSRATVVKRASNLTSCMSINTNFFETKDSVNPKQKPTSLRITREEHGESKQGIWV